MNHIYLCGPVTGRRTQEAVEHFNKVEQRIRDAAKNNRVTTLTLNPTRFCPPDIDWHKAMRACVGELVKCGGIALLQGWQSSRGAALELKIAQELQIPVVYAEPPLDWIGLHELFVASPESLRYYNARLAKFQNEGVFEKLAEDRAMAELTNRYLDPYGFEYISCSQEG